MRAWNPQPSQDASPLAARVRRAAALPGFVNAFAEGTPTKPAARRREVLPDDDGRVFFASARSPPSSPSPAPAVPEDEPMADAAPIEDPAPASAPEEDAVVQDVEMGVEPPAWRDEVRFLLFL